jgi:hypothetical protein
MAAEEMETGLRSLIFCSHCGCSGYRFDRRVRQFGSEQGRCERNQCCKSKRKQDGARGLPRGIDRLPEGHIICVRERLAASGWRVEITTASSQAPSNLSKYSLLVLGFPTYGSALGQTIVRYLDRLGDLHGINTAIIALASSTPQKSADVMTQKVQAANGTVVKSFALASSITLIGIAPSAGTGSPAEIAQQAGTQIRP